MRIQSLHVMRTYHHCAELQITADRSKPLDNGWPAERTSE
jgi:hypothetical protein